MKCFFGGGSSMRKEYLLEENAMLQRMLLQEQRDKMELQQQLSAERMKCAMLEQEIAQAALAADEMGHNLAQYFGSRAAASPSDTHASADQQQAAGFGGNNRLQAAAHSAFGPASMQLQCIPEHMQKQQEMLEFAEQVKDFAASLQHRLAIAASAGTTPKAAAAAAAAGPFGRAASPPPAAPHQGAASAAAAAGGHLDRCSAGRASAAPSRAHSSSHTSSLPSSDAQGSMDLPMQALAVSRLALQLHQPQGPEEHEASCFSSSCRRSSCTVLGGSVDLTSSIGSMTSYLHSHHSAATGFNGGAFEALLGAAEGSSGAAAGPHQHKPIRSAAVRSSVTRSAAAVASSCASIAAAAAATAAAAAAKKAAAAAAMADASQAHADLRASTESGFSSITSRSRSCSSLSATLRQRKQWQQAHEQWDAHSRQQQHHRHQHTHQQQQHVPEPVEQQQQQEGGPSAGGGVPLPVDLPGEEECSELSSAQSSPVGAAPAAAGAGEEQQHNMHWNPTYEQVMGAGTDTEEESSSCSRPASASPAAGPCSSTAQAAAAAVQQQPKLPAVPAFLGAAQRVQALSMQLSQVQQQQQSQQQQRPYRRYGSDKLSAATTLTSPVTETTSTGSTAALAAASRPSPAASFSSKPPAHLPRLSQAPSGATPQQQHASVGPLHRHLSSLCSSSSSFRLATGTPSATHCNSSTQQQ